MPIDMSMVSASQYAPKSYDAGYVVLSYTISLIGSVATLELLQQRTSGRGLYNWYLLFGSAVTMGGIAIWSMHFIGNRATVLYDGSENLQLSYSATYTVLSFFVPIFVLLGAYSLAGSSDEVQKVRVALGGLFAGSSICGMHYLGDAGISNYRSKYSVPYVVGSVIIAVASTNVALTLFFLMRKKFTNSWWKRIIIGAVLASGVTGMHWVASVGTTYTFKHDKPLDKKQNSFSRQWIVVIVIVLAVFSCIVLLAFAVAAGRGRRTQRRRAQRIALASATFEDGKLMVLPDGTLPIKTITDTFSERSFEESFGKRHSVFHWAYRTSRNWRGVVDLLPGMRRHLRGHNAAPRHTEDFFEEYSVIFREMFCVAAKDLADAMHQPLQSVGVLHEDLLITGSSSSVAKLDSERGSNNRGGGKVLFLVRNVDKAEAARLGTFGFRFTQPSNVYDILSRTMQIAKEDVKQVITTMATYDSEREVLLAPGVYLGCFAMRADVKGGFDVLVRQSETSRLPIRPLGITALSAAHFRFLQQYNGKTAGEVIQGLRNNLVEAAQSAGLTEAFPVQFSEALSHLLAEVKDNIFANAVLDANPQFLPTASPEEDTTGSSSAGTTAQLIAFKLMVPIHTNIVAPNLIFTPLSFFSTRQRCYPGCPEHEVHARRVHREFSGRAVPQLAGQAQSRARRFSIWKPNASGSSSSSSSRFGRRLGLAHGTQLSSERSLSMSSEKNLVMDDQFSSVGIMVSQTVTVAVAEPKSATELKDMGPRVAVSKLDESTDNLTWCEALFKGVVQDMK